MRVLYAMNLGLEIWILPGECVCSVELYAGGCQGNRLEIQIEMHLPSRIEKEPFSIPPTPHNHIHTPG